jgi:hypothetical protein
MKLRPKNAKVASASGFLILVALIWFVGPFFGLDRFDAPLFLLLQLLVLGLCKSLRPTVCFRINEIALCSMPGCSLRVPFTRNIAWRFNCHEAEA